MDLCIGPATLYTKKSVYASKDICCNACQEIILQHSRYIRVGILFDGNWETVRRCLRCEAIHAHLVALHNQRCRVGRDGNEWPSDRLDCGHEYEEIHGKPPPEEVAALAFALPGDDPEVLLPMEDPFAQRQPL